MVSYLVMVVGLCTDDLKSGGEELRADQTHESRFATRYQCFCASFGFTAVCLRLYSRLFMASQPSTAL